MKVDESWRVNEYDCVLYKYCVLKMSSKPN